jgi:tetratricopeptide (TPR) repeat protein
VKRLLGLISVLALLTGVIWGVSGLLPSSHNTESPRQRLDQAIRALQTGDEKTLAEIRKSFARDVRSDEYDHYFDGLIAMRRRQWELAEKELSQVDPSGDLRSFVLFSKAELLYQMGRLSEAEFVLQQLVRDFGNHLDAHRLLGAIYYDLGSYDLAILHLEQVVEQDPNSVGSQRLLGLMYHDFEQESQASEHYRAALALAPPEPMRQELVVEFSQSLIAQKEFEEALDLLNDADLSQQTIALRARCLWNLNRTEEARELLREAPSEENQDRLMCLMQLQIKMDDRDWEQAVIAANNYLEQDPFDAEIRYQLAQAYARLNRQQDFEREIAVYQKNTEASRRLTELNVKAVQDSRDPIVRDQLAELCDSLGKKELAAMWREAAQNCREGRALYSDQKSTAGQPSAH